MEIIPAILPKDFRELEEKINLIKDFTKTIQIDICDGQFVPNATWPYKKHDDTFDKILSEEIGMPAWDKVNVEIDLMANRPEEVVLDWVKAGATRVTLHVEAKGNIAEAINILKGKVQIGMAINIDTESNMLDRYADDIDVIQCMGIARIGFQGQDFDNRVIEKIAEMKKLYPNKLITVDGGVTRENIDALIEAGAERLVVGSAIFGSDNPIDSLMGFESATSHI